MKKILLMLSIALLTACGNEVVSEENIKDVVEDVEENENAQNEEATTESEYLYPTNNETIGDAIITISTPSGNTEDGNIPVLFVSTNDSMIQIGADYDEFDGSVETFVYINEVFVTIEQAGERYQSTLSLWEDNLKPGEYTVTAVQYTDNDPSKEPINLTKATFKIKKSS